MCILFCLSAGFAMRQTGCIVLLYIGFSAYLVALLMIIQKNSIAKSVIQLYNYSNFDSYMLVNSDLLTWGDDAVWVVKSYIYATPCRPAMMQSLARLVARHPPLGPLAEALAKEQCRHAEAIVEYFHTVLDRNVCQHQTCG